MPEKPHASDTTATIATLSGLPLNYFDPNPTSLVLHDMVEGAAKCCRFGGQCYGWWSVARHQVLGSYYAKNPIEFLFHDQAEGYMGDCATPLKRQLPEWKPIENRLLRRILQRFDIPFVGSPVEEDDPLTEDVHRVDWFMYVHEWHALMRRDKIDWHYPGEPEDIDLVTRIRYEAETSDWRKDYYLWMERYHELRGG